MKASLIRLKIEKTDIQVMGPVCCWSCNEVEQQRPRSQPWRIKCMTFEFFSSIKPSLTLIQIWALFIRSGNGMSEYQNGKQCGIFKSQSIWSWKILSKETSLNEPNCWIYRYHNRQFCPELTDGASKTYKNKLNGHLRLNLNVSTRAHFFEYLY